jgi:predicted RecB family nuclease
MQKSNSQIIYSPSDLCRYMNSPFASWMERYAIERPDMPFEQDASDPLMDILQTMGNAHESVHLKKLRDEGKTIVEVSGPRTADKVQATREAIASGADVIYQPCLEGLPFRGYADFLVKVPDSCDGKSRLGDFHYEVWDTKLARHVKPHFVMQLCCYAEMLYEIQGCYASEVAVVLGNDTIERFRTDDYRFYYQHLKTHFLAVEAAFDFDTMPDPADSADWGRWSSVVKGLFEERDHLNQVATITRSQIKALKKVGIATAAQLAKAEETYVPKIAPAVLQRLKAQSRMQMETRRLQGKGIEIPAYEIVLPEDDERRGLALLPPASPFDVFFDIEGFPLIEGGLEYLWGNTYFDAQGKRQFKDFWAHTGEEEKSSFQAFVHWVYARWQEDPSMHIYHYANYEIAACRKLMGRYGVCEHEIDQLLRNEVFVDLYNIVRHGLLLGEPRYSIKNVEHLYRERRQTDVESGGDSVVVYEHWRSEPDGETWESSKVLKAIRDYNQDDCESTQELVDWLRERQVENEIAYLGKTEVVEPEVTEEITARIHLRDRLLVRAEQEKEGHPELADVIETLAHLLEFHRREDKPGWWRLFDRLGLTEIELTDDPDCIVSCRRTATEPFKPTPRARSLAFEYAFDINQELKPSRPDTPMWVLGEDGMKFTLHEMNGEKGLLILKGQEEPPPVVTLIPNNIVRARPIPESIEQVVADLEEGFADGSVDLPENAIADFLMRRKPRIKGHSGGDIVRARGDQERLQEVIEAVLNLDSSYLCIQGPPGAGKTFTGQHVIAELVSRGLKVGICSNSHKAINNLLLGVADTCQEKHIAVACYCTSDTGDEIERAGITLTQNNELSGLIRPGCVIGTTAWGFSRDDVAGAFDYLFIDEAGQVSLANLVGISRAARNLVMMGDQMQLGQPIQGHHPGFSGQSVLEYLLQDHATIPDDLGVFLGTTYRMHPAVNRFISDAIYEGRLEPASGNEQRVVTLPKGYAGELNKEAGILFVPVEHEGNVQSSVEEAEKVREIAGELRKRTFIDKDGTRRKLDWPDLLFVAPYNYQVNTIKAILGEKARVGSVDRFQGQEAPVVIMSLATSEAGESPRGMSFLLDKHRLNVAISRAQSLAIVVANPRLIQNFNGSLRDMALVNLFAKVMGESDGGAIGDP